MTDERHDDDPSARGVSRRDFLGKTAVAGVGAAALGAGEARAGGLLPQTAQGSPRGLLYPRQNQHRSVLDLSGFWQFQLDPKEEGEAARWWDALPSPRTIAVPCSWNDLFDDARDYLGLAWYRIETWIPQAWRGQRVLLRVGSANYAAKVWVNGVLVAEHLGGHLPFVADVTARIAWNQPTAIAIAVENKPLPDRVPAGPSPSGGGFAGLSGGYPATTYDFFPYAGLQRPVLLFSVPPTHIEDVTVRTTLEGADGRVDVRVNASAGYSGGGRASLGAVGASLRFRDGVAEATLRVPAARFWSPQDPYLYSLSLTLGDGRGATDSYTLDVGIRTIEVSGDRLLLNGKPIALTGFGKHEDFPINGRGLNVPLIVRDYELLRWVGANSYRTAHYPYSEEAMALADRLGVLVIDEIPAVSLGFGDSPELLARRLEQCQRALDELIARDKNHPSVVMWCVANEPMAGNPMAPGGPPAAAVEAGKRFLTTLYDQARARDASRPVTMAGVMNGPLEWLAPFDVTSVNRYYGWYSLGGRLEAAARGARQGARRSARALRKADRDHGVRHRHRGGKPQPARGDVDRGVPGRVPAPLPRRGREPALRRGPARLELRRLQDRPGHHPSRRPQPEGRLHARSPAQDGRAFPPFALASGLSRRDWGNLVRSW